MVGNRTGKQSGCPCCSGRKVSVTNSLSSLFPEVAAQWHPYKNNQVTPDQVVAMSHHRRWWICPEGLDHEWQTSVSNRTGVNKTGCPSCAGYKVSVTNSLSSLFPMIATQWHPTKNIGVRPEEVLAGTLKKYWWICPEGPDHEWQASVIHRTLQGVGCLCCSGRKASVTNSIWSLFPKVALQWHSDKNHEVTPDQVVYGSNKKYWWICPKGPDHEWQAQPVSRTMNKQGCPCCAGLKVSVTDSLSFISPEVAAQWHPQMNTGLTPDKIVAWSNRNVWWKCQNGADHEWRASPNNRIGVNKTGCPYCRLAPRSQQEIYLAFELLLFFDFEIDDHKETADGHLYDCDIIIRKHGLIIEFDGGYFHRGKEQTDIDKTVALKSQGWTVIRVRECPLNTLSPQDISIPERADMKTVSNAVLLKIQEISDTPIGGIDQYLKLTDRQNHRASEAFSRKALKARRT